LTLNKIDQFTFVDERLFLTITDLYIAGTDTTSVTLQWSMLYMLKYPDVQKKCRDQILEVCHLILD